MEDQAITDILKEILASIKSSKSYKSILTVDELCSYSGFSKSYIYKLSSQREIPHYKVNGRSIFFKKKEIDAWLLSSPVPTVDLLLESSLVKKKNIK